MTTLAEFKSALTPNTNYITLLYLTAKWCGPCKGMAPIITELSSNQDFTLIKVDIDDSPELMSEFSNVRGVPSFLLFKGADLIAQKVGATTKAALQAFVESHR